METVTQKKPMEKKEVSQTVTQKQHAEGNGKKAKPAKLQNESPTQAKEKKEAKQETKRTPTEKTTKTRRTERAKSKDPSEAFLWNHQQARSIARSNSGPSNCGATALLNVLASLKVECPD